MVEESDTLQKDKISMKKGNAYALGKEKGGCSAKLQGLLSRIH